MERCDPKDLLVTNKRIMAACFNKNTFHCFWASAVNGNPFMRHMSKYFPKTSRIHKLRIFDLLVLIRINVFRIWIFANTLNMVKVVIYNSVIFL